MGFQINFSALKDKSPVISGEDVVFFYRGKAESVCMAGDYNRWEPQDKMRRFQDSDLWYTVKTFPKNARFDYKYIVDGRWITDPLNENVSPGGSGDNSTLIMPEYRSEYENILRQDVPRGTLIKDLKAQSKHLRKEMKWHVYLPPGYEKNELRHILYALDGSDYLNYAKIERVLDYLIYKGEIPEMAAVLADPDDRDTEYTVYEPYLQYITEELMPLAEKEYLHAGKDSEAQPMDRSVIGVSWGGLTAICLGVGSPGMFGRLLSQSGSFWPKDFVIFKRIAEAPLLPIRFCLQTGTVADTEEMNDAMAELLMAKGYAVAYEKYAETHSWFNWKGHLDEGLKKLYADPLTQ